VQHFVGGEEPIFAVSSKKPWKGAIMTLTHGRFRVLECHEDAGDFVVLLEEV
jgi:hypothetical protein